jgi:hypothetical protein
MVGAKIFVELDVKFLLLQAAFGRTDVKMIL